MEALMASFCMAAGIDEAGWQDGALEIGLDRLGSFLEKLQEEASIFEGVLGCRDRQREKGMRNRLE
jgi:hypothetical protein